MKIFVTGGTGNIKWNIEREQKVLAGEKVHDVYHVW
jgi:hypothetical protein